MSKETMTQDDFQLPPERPKTDLEKWLGKDNILPTNWEIQQQMMKDNEFPDQFDIAREKQTKVSFSWEWKF